MLMVTNAGDPPYHKPRKTKRSKPPLRRPGYDNSFELGARIVDDPYEPGNKITVPANVRSDTILRMFNRGDLDEAQYQAGQRLRLLIEQAGERGAPAVDPSKEPVDGSPKVREPALVAFRAAKELKECALLLGLDTWRVVRGIVADGLNSTLISQATNNRIDREHVANTLRFGLERIAIKWRILSGPEYENKYAAMVAYMHETAVWMHEEAVLKIEYATKPLTTPRRKGTNAHPPK